MSNQVIALTILGVTIAQVLAIAILIIRAIGLAGEPLTADEKQSLAVKLVGLLLGIVFTELLQFNFLPDGIFPNAAPFVLIGLCGIVVGAGGDSAIGIVKLFGAGVQLVQAQVAKAKTPTALIQGESLKPYTPLTEFSDAELRAIAYKLGALPPGNISHDGLVMQILAASAPKVAT